MSIYILQKNKKTKDQPNSWVHFHWTHTLKDSYKLSLHFEKVIKGKSQFVTAQ